MSRLDRYSPISYWLKSSTPWFVKYLVAFAMSLPLAYWFFKLEDAYNVLNYILIVPMYYALPAIVLRDVDRGFLSCIESFTNEEIRSKFFSDEVGLPITNNINYGLIIFIITILCLFTQLEYIWNDLSLFYHKPFLHSWGKFHDINYQIPRRIFFEYYIFSQYIELFYITLSLIAFFEYTYLARILFVNNVDSYVPKHPEKYLDFAEFRRPIQACFFMGLFLSLNALTYAITVSPTATLNLIYFVIGIVAYTTCAILLSIYCNQALKSGKKKIKNRIKSSSTISEIDKHNLIIKCEEIVQDSIFNLNQYITGVLITVLNVIAIIGAFLPEANKQEVLRFLENLWRFF